MLRPLRFALAGVCSPNAAIWRDSIVGRDLDASIDRLRDEMIRQQSEGGRTAIVTHSFGDWIVRQAIADFSQPPISALVSIAPLMSASPIGRVLRLVSGRCISEVPIMADASRAGVHVAVDSRIRRLILWAAVDAWVRPFAIDEQENLTVRYCCGTHLSLVLQPNVQRFICRFLQAAATRESIARA
ncbi:MAG: hypothetical protein ACO1RT_14915 [Planctomycetaceae bacterium]